MVDAADATGTAIGALKRITPRVAQSSMARLLDGTTNLAERILGWRDGAHPVPTPPLRLRLHVGPFLDPRLFRYTAERNVVAFRDLADLRPNATFLDIGCGVGRIAAALSTYLDGTGRYEGFDAAKQPVEWCRRMITSKFPNFHFQTIDTFSMKYNPSGKADAAQLIFPYGDDTFDLVFAGSVFTHLLPEEAQNFVEETARALKPGGKMFATFCLLNQVSMPVVEAGKSSPRLPHRFREFRLKDEKDPASFIAQPERFVRELYSKAGLSILEPIRYGTWARSPEMPEAKDAYCFAQDIVLATKIHAS